MIDEVRTFVLQRDVDVTGVSGTGVIAEGVQFTDGTVVLHWLGEHRSSALWDDLDTMIAVHGHDGMTVVVWDIEPDPTEVTAPSELDDLISRAINLGYDDGVNDRPKPPSGTPTFFVPAQWLGQIYQGYADGYAQGVTARKQGVRG